MIPGPLSFVDQVKDLARRVKDLETSKASRAAVAALVQAHDYTPILTAGGSNPTGYTAEGRFIQVGSLVWYWFFIALGSNVGSGYYMVSMPVAPRAQIVNRGVTGNGPGAVIKSNFNAMYGQWNVYTNSRLILRVPTSFTAVANVTDSTPLALSNGSSLSGQVVYEAAA